MTNVNRLEKKRKVFKLLDEGEVFPGVIGKAVGLNRNTVIKYRVEWRKLNGKT